MQTLTQNQIKEIAEQIECGLCSYINKITGETLFIPNFDVSDYDGKEFYAVDLEKLEADLSNFIKIDTLNSRESFEIMECFVEKVDNQELKKKLINALSRRKPFREFKLIIDNSGIYRDLWFTFKSNQIQQLVVEKLQDQFL